jgi:FMN reductase
MTTVRHPLSHGERGPGPLVVGLGGTARADSSTERVLKLVLDAVEQRGARTRLFRGRDLDLPMYNPENDVRDSRAVALLEALRSCDAVVVASPGYHGALSGLVKNALDYVEDLRADERTYLEQRAFGCVSCAYGWQAAVATLTQLRTIAHALRAWPTPLGLAVNSAELRWDAQGLPADGALTAQIDTLAEQLLSRHPQPGEPAAVPAAAAR